MTRHPQVSVQRKAASASERESRDHVAAQSAAVILYVRILTGQQCSYLLLKVEGMHRKAGCHQQRVAARVAPTPKRLRPECTCNHEAEQPRYTAAAAGGLHDGIRLLAWSPRRQKVAMFGIIVDHSGKVSSRPALSKHSKEHTLRHTGPPEYCAPSP